MIIAGRMVALITAVAAALAGCGDDAVCGPQDAGPDGITIAVDQETITYGGFTSSPNNDCSAGGGPTSLTIESEQIDPPASATFHLTFCLPNPDEIGREPIPIDDADRVQVVDVSGEIDDCRIVRDSDETASGTIQFVGFCNDGLDPAGYALELSATVPGKRLCDGVPEQSVSLSLTGRVAVEAINL